MNRKMRSNAARSQEKSRRQSRERTREDPTRCEDCGGVKAFALVPVHVQVPKGKLH